MDGLGDVPPVTVFLPSDRAWSSLSQQQRDFLYDPHNREQLLEYVRYHVVPSRQVGLSQTPWGSGAFLGLIVWPGVVGPSRTLL